MNQYVIRPRSLVQIIENTVKKNPDVKLYRARYLFKKWNITNRPVRFSYSGKSSIAVKLQVEVKFGVDVMKALDKMSSEIRGNLDKLAKVTMRSCVLTVKGVYHEKENS
jgi:uncharacterized alkaline shock family protein YloU